MGRYLIRRTLFMILVLFIVSLITFLIFVKLPAADPARRAVGRATTPENVEAARKAFGLDKPIWVQYGRFAKGLIPWPGLFLNEDVYYSYSNFVPVKEEIFSRLPVTIALALGAAVVWMLIGIPIGIISAIKRGTILDRAAMGFALLAISAPVYWVGLVSIYLFSKDLGKLVPIFQGSGQYTPFTQDPIAWASALILPWLVLATAFAAIYARFLRANLLDVMGEDYIRTARAKGLSERRVVFRHGLRSAITPIVTIFGLDLGILLGGAILTETVFNIPGIGRLAFDAIQKSDLPIVQGTVLIAAFAVIMANLIVDILYAFLDPRVRY
jgi:peptide/nickel transport system permease protein